MVLVDVVPMPTPEPNQALVSTQGAEAEPSTATVLVELQMPDPMPVAVSIPASEGGSSASAAAENAGPDPEPGTDARAPAVSDHLLSVQEVQVPVEEAPVLADPPEVVEETVALAMPVQTPEAQPGANDPLPSEASSPQTLRGAQWLREQAPGSYAIQIMGSRDAEALQRFALAHRLSADAAWFTTTLAERPGTYSFTATTRPAPKRLPQWPNCQPHYAPAARSPAPSTSFSRSRRPPRSNTLPLGVPRRMNDLTAPAGHRLLKALAREPVDRTPVWLMRQAGRYLPEYREMRAQAGSFKQLCTTPDLACEVTLQPLRRFPLDAAIVFSDILTIPDAMGLGLQFVEGEGPRFERPVRSGADIRALHVPDPEAELGYVMQTLRLVRSELDDKVPLIGFSGSPWTLATYMVEGGASSQFQIVKALLYEHREDADRLLQLLARSVIDYLQAQIDAGAQAVMIFDTWGGALAADEYRELGVGG